MKQLFKNIIIVFVSALITLFLILIGSYEWISYSTEDHLTDKIENVTPTKTALVLGTSKYVVGGGINLFFKYRMEAVKELFDHGKIEYIIVSGDNSQMEYNETRDMRRYLVKLGVPRECIIEDFAGFSTLDSVIRSKEVFGQKEILIVSQPFHNERAVFIAHQHNIIATGFNAQNVRQKYTLKVYFREYLARLKCLLDIYIWHSMPKFYKDKEMSID